MIRILIAFMLMGVAAALAASGQGRAGAACMGAAALLALWVMIKPPRDET